MQEETFHYYIMVADKNRDALAAVNLYGGGDAAFFDVYVMPGRTREEFEVFLDILKNFLATSTTRIEVPPPQGDTKQ